MDNLQIAVYNSGEIEIDVSVKNEMVWATVKDIAHIFEIDRSVVSRHIKNIFKDKELDEKVVCANFAHTTKHGAISDKTQTREIKYYNLDIILAVGYRTNSTKAIKFRRWATNVLKEYIFNNYAINREKITQQRIANLENDVRQIKSQLQENTLQIKQGIFYDGEIFDAYHFVNNLLKEAKGEVKLIDNYVDDTVLTLFSKYQNITFTIITKNMSKQLKLDIQKYNAQYGNLNFRTSNKYHDRFLIIDDTTYHLGASLKDLGKKIFAFSKMSMDVEDEGQ